MLKRVLTAAGFILVAALNPAPAHAAPVAAAPAAAIGIAADVGPCAYSGAHPTIRNGSKGGPTAHLQCLLRNVWGYREVTVDGDFGPITENAVRTHQKDCHIKQDGVVGPVTWSRLHPDSTTAQCRDAGRD
jgi:peptidoglycan hydrolase-like protein with peptidoglycan-binding domain